MSATSNEGNSNTGMQSNTQSESSVPDLNIPLVEEFSVEQTPTYMTSTDRLSKKYSSKVNYHSRKGGLAEFREKERERLKRYRSGLTEEEKKSQIKRVMQRREEKKKAVSNQNKERWKNFVVDFILSRLRIFPTGFEFARCD